MKTAIILSVLCLLAASAWAERYTLDSRDGRYVDVTRVSYDGEHIKARREADGRLIRLRPSQLTEESWERLNRQATERMRVGLEVRSIATSRKTATHWSTSYGSSETTTSSVRKFDVKVTSTSHFRKRCNVVSYWITGDKARAERHEVTISRSEPFAVVVGGSASLYSLNLVAIGEYYSSGQSTDTDVVVVVEHGDGSLSEIYATTQSAEDLIRRQYED